MQGALHMNCGSHNTLEIQRCLNLEICEFVGNREFSGFLGKYSEIFQI